MRNNFSRDACLYQRSEMATKRGKKGLTSKKNSIEILVKEKIIILFDLLPRIVIV